MKKYLHIPIAILLIAIGIWGCTLNRPRPLLACFPTDDWTAVSGSHMMPGGDSDDVLDIDPEELKELMHTVDVRPRSSFGRWTCETVSLHLAAEETTLSVEIGQDGCITIAEPDNPEKTRTFWRAENADLYQTLLDFCQP